MASFYVDQVRQFYIAKSKGAPVDATSPAGALSVKSSAEDVWFEYATPNGDNGEIKVTRSDLIPKKNIEYATYSLSKAPKIKTAIIKFDNAVNGGVPIPGQDYILRFTFMGITLGGRENQYIKLGGAYRAKTGDTAAKVLEQLVDLAKVNFSRETFKMVEIKTDTYNGTGAAPGTSTQLIIKGLTPPWVLGKRQGDPVDYMVHLVPVNATGVEAPWGTIEYGTQEDINLVGKQVADMEWFYIGERADQFRGVGYPDNFDTVYLADPNMKYALLDICFFYAGDTEDIQKSKKVLTIATPVTGGYPVADLLADVTATGIVVEDKR